MADSKISALVELLTPQPADLLVVVDNTPATPVTKNVKLSSLSQAVYGALTFVGTGVDHNPTTTPVKLTDFDTVGGSKNVTADTVGDTLTVTRAGTYAIDFKITATANAANTYQFFVKVDNVQQNALPTSPEKGALLRESARGYIDLPLGTEVLDIWVSSDAAGGATLIPEVIAFSCERIGSI